MCSRAAICRLLKPAAIRTSTSRSRSVSPSWAGVGRPSRAISLASGARAQLFGRPRGLPDAGRAAGPVTRCRRGPRAVEAVEQAQRQLVRLPEVPPGSRHVVPAVVLDQRAQHDLPGAVERPVHAEHRIDRGELGLPGRDPLAGRAAGRPHADPTPTPTVTRP
ncbi:MULTISPECIES: hypothetical protein [unclassified Nonomuraea]|uniref:hypothetical protein n=1 Tax=unclassified Nonomuraea TaxID=2593643 RepID=UPI0033ED5DEA